MYISYIKMYKADTSQIENQNFMIHVIYHLLFYSTLIFQFSVLNLHAK